MKNKLTKIEDQEENQMKAIKAIKQPASINNHNNELLISKEREIFKNIYNEILNKIEELDKKINYDDLIFLLKAEYSKLILSKKTPDPITFPNDIKTGEITIGEAKASQEDFSK